MDKLNGNSLDIEKMNIEKIKDLIPNVVMEGKIDFEKLKIVLGDEVDESPEKYQFTWNGKRQAIKLSQTPSTGTLIPSKEDSKDWDTTENMYIEGDNLEVLKLLQKTYYNKIKMVYIDPPYNTGGDFVYKDDFKDNIRNYKEQTSQTQRSNPETSGRYHTDWLNMMYSRLMIARNLLSDDGVIAISIDGNEVHNMRKICDEIFGESNYVNTFVWQKNFAPKNDNKYISTSHEYIILFAKKINLFKRNLLPREAKHNKGYSNPDNDVNGLWTSGTMLATTYNEKYVFEIVAPNGKVHLPPAGRCWRYSLEKVSHMIASNNVWFGKDGNGVPRVKRYLKDMPDGVVPQTWLKYEEVGSGQDGTQELKKLFSNTVLFDYPKPTKLIQRIIRIATNESDIILDFFSGSATTAHATMKLNAETGSKRKFIMVQLPVKIDEKNEAFKAGFKDICEIGKERTRRVGSLIKNELIEKKENSGMVDENIVDPESLDYGFKVFKLESTNIIPWDGTIVLNEQSLFNSLEVIKENRSKYDVLYEVMLKFGVFDMPVEELEVHGKTVFSIGMGYLLLCLEDSIDSDLIQEIGKMKPHNVIFLESGFKDDNVKINALYTLKKLDVEEIKCI